MYEIAFSSAMGDHIRKEKMIFGLFSFLNFVVSFFYDLAGIYFNIILF